MSEKNDGLASFETSLKELESLIETLERGDLTLAEGLEHFERGVALTKQCQATLETAEQRVRTLLAENNFQPDDQPDNDAGER